MQDTNLDKQHILSFTFPEREPKYFSLSQKWIADQISNRSYSSLYIFQFCLRFSISVLDFPIVLHFHSLLRFPDIGPLQLICSVRNPPLTINRTNS